VNAAPLAGEGDQEVVSALRAMGAGETVGENAALPVATELARNGVGDRIGVIQLAASQCKPSLEVSLDRAIRVRAPRATRFA
jgi:hypothetical protein